MTREQLQKRRDEVAQAEKIIATLDAIDRAKGVDLLAFAEECSGTLRERVEYPPHIASDSDREQYRAILAKLPSDSDLRSTAYAIPATLAEDVG